MKRYWHAEYFDAVERLRALSERIGRSLVEISLRWLLDQDVTDSVILGASKIEHLQANIRAALTEPLPQEANEELDSIWRRLHGPTPNYNR